MPTIDMDRRTRSRARAPDDLWQSYRQALEQAECSYAPPTEATTALRGQAGHPQLWRTQLSQALAHWQLGAFAPARACALAAQRMAEETGESFAVGYVTCQLASMALGQDDYQAAADQFTQAQLALEAGGLAPPGGALASAAQLCIEIIHWRHAYQLGQIAQPAVDTVIARAQH